MNNELLDLLLLYDAGGINISLTFTSATSSTSSSYTAQVEGTAGQTVNLFRGATDLGAMTETSPGVYTKAVTLADLSTDLVAKVNGVEYDALTVALPYANWQETGSLVFMGGVPESAWLSATGGYSAGATAPGRTVLAQLGVHSNTSIEQIDLNLEKLADGSIKFKHVRHDGSTWSILATETVAVGPTGKNSYVLSIPFDANVGDGIAVFIPSPNIMYLKAQGYQVGNTKYQDVDWGGGADLSSSLHLEIEMQFLGKRASLGIAGDSIPTGAANWDSPYDGAASYKQIPGGNQLYDLGYQIEQNLSGLRWINYSKGSQTWAYAAATAFPQLIASDVHTALLMFGVNDVSQARTWANVEADLDAIKAAWDASNIERLWISQILPWTAGNDTQAATIRTWNSNLATWCAANGATLLETHDAMGQTRVSTGEIDDLKTAYNSDGVHLTQAGMEALAAIVTTYL